MYLCKTRRKNCLSNALASECITVILTLIQTKHILTQLRLATVALQNISYSCTSSWIFLKINTQYCAINPQKITRHSQFFTSGTIQHLQGGGSTYTKSSKFQSVIQNSFSIISSTNFNAQFNNNMYVNITILDMFRALTCPSSGGTTAQTQHLVSSLS